MNDELRWYLEEIHARAKYLARDMERLCKRIEEDGEKASINSSGEIQGQALEIDRLCAVAAWIKHHPPAKDTIQAHEEAVARGTATLD